MNKGQADTWVWFGVFLFMMAIVGGGIAWGVLAFFGGEYDFRPHEAVILNDRIQHCLAQLLPGTFTEKIFYEKCQFNQDVLEEYFILQILEEEKQVFAVGSGFENCRLTGALGNPAYPKCSIQQLTLHGKQYEILVGSKQKARTRNIGVGA